VGKGEGGAGESGRRVHNEQTNPPKSLVLKFPQGGKKESLKGREPATGENGAGCSSISHEARRDNPLTGQEGHRSARGPARHWGHLEQSRPYGTRPNKWISRGEEAPKGQGKGGNRQRSKIGMSGSNGARRNSTTSPPGPQYRRKSRNMTILGTQPKGGCGDHLNMLLREN